ncbi:MAG: GspH/FimT family pseudopilin [Methylobacter sp.]
MKKLRNSGFTLLELMLVIAIIAILAALAVPSFSTTLAKQRTTGAAEAVLADLRWARAEAIKRNRNVRVTFTNGSAWHYTIHADPAGSNTQLKTVDGSDFPSITLATASFDNSVAYTTFESTRGTSLNSVGSLSSNEGTVTITSNNFSVSVIVSPLGSARICGSMGGYETCP